MSHKAPPTHSSNEGRGFAAIAQAIRDHTAAEKRKSENELQTRPRGKPWLKIAALVVSSLYLGATILIWLATRDSVNELRRQLAIMEKSQGASLFVNFTLSSDYAFIVFTVTNSGQVAAKNAVICGSVLVKAPENQLVSREYRLGGDNNAIPPGNIPYRFGKLPLAPKVGTGLKDGIVGLAVGGAIAFDNGLNIRSRQNICGEFERGEWSPCRTFDNPITLTKESPPAPRVMGLDAIAENCK